MRLIDVVTTSQRVGATASRTAKRDLIAALVREAGDDVALVVDYLTAAPRQRRTGVGWRTLAELPPPAAAPSLTLRDVDTAFYALAGVAGAGSAAARRALVDGLFARATDAEQAFLRALLFAELRQGALGGVMLDAIAAAAGVPVAAVRRAAMLTGSPSATAVRAMRGGEEDLASVGLTVGVPVSPMLAASAGSVQAAVDLTVDDRPGPFFAVDAKIDGFRIQIHRDGDDVRLFTRSLDEVTGRMPEVEAVVRALPVTTAILDGEVVMMGADGRTRPFQETGARAARRDAGADAARLTLFLFDALHLDGVDLIDRPAVDRLAALDDVAGDHVVPRLVTDDVAAASAAFDEWVAAGFEGVVMKSLDAPYAAGRRGSAWIKVKPVHTFDLVVLGVEWGSGRRRGRLSNIHLGARDPATGGFVMVGKTFKGMTDAMLAWQTERFLELESGREGHVVWVRPEQVVEIALDGVQRSRRYPGGVALRFARVVRYRDDKGADAVDTIDDVRRLLDGGT